MVESRWLTIVGIGEDGPSGLPVESRVALTEADVIIGPARHLSLLGPAVPNGPERVEWPSPFADGIQALLALRPRRVVALASGCPFWFGAGAVIAAQLPFNEWRCVPAPSTFSLAAARMGWSLEGTHCLGLHAAPLDRLRPYAASGVRALLLLRGPSAAEELLTWLRNAGFADSRVTFLEAVGGPRERLHAQAASCEAPRGLSAPLAAAVLFHGSGPALPLAAGMDDAFFGHDGQLTKGPVRALTLSALAPLPGELLWDLGAGAGSVAIEWLLCDASLRAIAVEQNPARATRAARNAAKLGVDRLELIQGDSLDTVAQLPPPDAVFIGGGANDALVEAVLSVLRPGGRLVINAVTLETEALVARWRARAGGELLRLALSRPEVLGSHEAWQAARPITQWTLRGRECAASGRRNQS